MRTIQISHSRVEQFEKCKFKYKLKYIDGLKTLPDDDAKNPLTLGTALHTAIEKNVPEAIKQYFSSYPIISDEHINESIKLEKLVPKALELLPKNGMHEVKIEHDDFIGFIDLLAPIEVPVNEKKAYVCDRCDKTLDCYCAYGGWCPDEKFTTYSEDTFDLYDFKYSNHVDKYLESRQLHLYKYFFELTNPTKKIRNMYFLFVPKIGIRQKKTETILDFRKRLNEELERAEVKLEQIDYDISKVLDFTFKIKHMFEEKNFEKNKSNLCNFCEFQKFCEEGIDYDIIRKGDFDK